MKWRWIVSLIGAGSLFLGMAYVAHVFGPTEAEVVTWGKMSVGLGVALGIWGIIGGIGPSGLVRVNAALLCGGSAVLQVLPIMLWVTFHGSGISDGTPPSPFVAHWGYALPHVALLVLSGVTIWRLKNPPKDEKSGR
mgnify:CR=1 FL=1